MMGREKSRLTEPAMYALGKMLKATVDENITEDIIRTVCRNIGIAAVAQAELSCFLKEFRVTYNSPQEKLNILADIIPEGLLTALLLVAQEFVNCQVNHVYQTDMHANRSLQNQLLALENSRAEACSATTAKEAECENLAKQLGLAQASVSSLTERVLALEKEKSYLQGRLEGNETKKTGVDAKRRRSRAKVAAPPDKKNRPQDTPLRKLDATHGEGSSPSPPDADGPSGGGDIG